MPSCYVFVLTFECFHVSQVIGVSLAQGVFGGTAIFVSYLWGVVAFHEIPHNLPLSVCGVAVLIGGVICIAFNGALTQRVTELVGMSGDEDTLPRTSLIMRVSGNLDSVEDRQFVSSSGSARRTEKPFTTGILWAVLTGTAGGSVLVPLHYAPSSAQGLAFVPSFGLGAIISAPVVAGLFFAHKGSFPSTHWQICLPVGILSGTLFNISNVLAIVAIPSLGYAVAYPILQCALFVAGMWGVMFFKEIVGYEIAVFFLSGVVLLGGAVAIAVAA